MTFANKYEFLRHFVSIILRYYIGQSESAPNVAVVHDTIVEHVYDTIRVETVPQVLLAKSDTKAEKVYKKTVNNTSANNNRRTSGNIDRTITEDGMNYSMLISCAY